MYYSQNHEDKKIASFFKGFIGTLLSIGENNGVDLSNAKHFIDKGWSAALVEPSPSVACALWTLHKENKNVDVYEYAISTKTGRDILWDSGTLFQKGDKALVSSLHYEETERWASMDIPFAETPVSTLTFKDFMRKVCRFKKFDYITIDAEGEDLAILKQMDLSALGCRCIVIEHNGNQNNLNYIIGYCSEHGLKRELGRNAENIILAA